MYPIRVQIHLGDTISNVVKFCKSDMKIVNTLDMLENHPITYLLICMSICLYLFIKVYMSEAGIGVIYDNIVLN